MSVEKALENVDAYGHVQFPVGEDRAALVWAAPVLAHEVRRLRGDVKMQSEMLSDWESDPECRRLRSRLASAERVVVEARKVVGMGWSVGGREVLAFPALLAALTHHDQEAAEGK